MLVLLKKIFRRIKNWGVYLFSVRDISNGNAREVLSRAALISLFVFLCIFSLSNIEESISLVKYHSITGISFLTENYQLFLHSPGDFVIRTVGLQTGDCEGGWRTLWYLGPLFVFSTLLGGLTLRNIYLFTITGSLAGLIFFYCWLRKTWGERVAFFAVFMFGFSAVFQEIARSGSYISFGVAVTIAWSFFLYESCVWKKALPFLGMGILTGLTWYGYGPLRSLFLVFCIFFGFYKAERKPKKFLFFLMGFFLMLLPGVFLKVAAVDWNCYREPLRELFFDQENISGFSSLAKNAGYFLDRISGGAQMIEPPLSNNVHAHFLNRLLLLPFVLGAIRAWQNRRDSRYLLLLLLSLLIYLPPLLFTSSRGYVFARRSLLYVVPTYLYVGLGMEQIVIFVQKVSAGWIRQGLRVIFAAGIIFVLCGEFSYFHSYIINHRRDLGLLSFAEAIRQRGLKGDLFYFEPDIPPGGWTKDISVYNFSRESDILQLVLMRPRVESPQVKSLTPATGIQDAVGGGYLLRSPLIAPEQLEDICQQNGLMCEPILESPLINWKREKLFPLRKGFSFGLYSVKARP